MTPLYQHAWRLLLRSVLGVFACILLILTLATNVLPTAAQGSNVLAKDSTVTGSINDQARVLLYSYPGTAGEVITAQVIGITQGMNPAISLLGPDQAMLANNNDDPTLMGRASDARTSYRLPVTGNYSLLVTGTNGDFLLRFTALGPFNTAALNDGVAANANLFPGTPPQAFSFNVAPGEAVTLHLNSLTPGFNFAAQIYNGAGQLVAALGGPGIQTEALTICGNSTLYEVIVGAADTSSQGAVALTVQHNAAGNCAAAPQDTSGIPPTLVSVGSTIVPQGVCSATNIKPNVINLRRGPSVFFNIVGQLDLNASVPVTGRSVDGQWYTAMDGTRQVWVAANVVGLNGPCQNLPTIQAPPPPFTRTPTHTPTFTPMPATLTPRVVTATPNVVTITPIIITQTPIVVTATPTNTPIPTDTSTP
jgi:hypothetical protein